MISELILRIVISIILCTDHINIFFVPGYEAVISVMLLLLQLDRIEFFLPDFLILREALFLPRDAVEALG